MRTRVTTLVADPAEPETVWAGVEIDGLYRSRDEGRTWQKVGRGLSSQDIHGLVLIPASGRSERMLASTNNDMNLSTDGGESWQPLRVGQGLPWSYCRGLGQVCGRPEWVLLGMGDRPPGCEGAVVRSITGGQTWSLTEMPGRANSTIWNFAVHPAHPEMIYASSISGQVYRALDRGESWTKLAREFGEIRALAWSP
jgi:photosystem II stability/assembly factor-like uncharacterized protein